MTKYDLIQECRISLTGHATKVIPCMNRLQKESRLNNSMAAREVLDNTQQLFLLKILNQLERGGNVLSLLKGI